MYRSLCLMFLSTIFRIPHDVSALCGIKARSDACLTRLQLCWNQRTCVWCYQTWRIWYSTPWSKAAGTFKGRISAQRNYLDEWACIMNTSCWCIFFIVTCICLHQTTWSNTASIHSTYTSWGKKTKSVYKYITNVRCLTVRPGIPMKEKVR